MMHKVYYKCDTKLSDLNIARWSSSIVVFPQNSWNKLGWFLCLAGDLCQDLVQFCHDVSEFGSLVEQIFFHVVQLLF